MKKRILFSPWLYVTLALVLTAVFQLARSRNGEVVMYHVVFSAALCVSVRFVISMYALGVCDKYDGIYCTEDERYITLLVLSLAFVSIIMGAFGALHMAMVTAELPNGIYAANHFPFIFSEGVTLTSTLCIMGVGALFEVLPSFLFKISTRFNLGIV